MRRYRRVQELHGILACRRQPRSKSALRQPCSVACRCAVSAVAGGTSSATATSCGTATPRRTSTTPAVSSIRARPGTTSSAPCGSRCRISLIMPFARVDAWWHSGLAGGIPVGLLFRAGRCLPLRGREAGFSNRQRPPSRRPPLRRRSIRTAVPAIHVDDGAYFFAGLTALLYFMVACRRPCRRRHCAGLSAMATSRATRAGS